MLLWKYPSPELHFFLLSDRAQWRSNLKQLPHPTINPRICSALFPNCRLQEDTSPVIPRSVAFFSRLNSCDHVAMSITGTIQAERLCFLNQYKHAVIDICILGKGDGGVTLITRTDRREKGTTKSPSRKGEIHFRSESGAKTFQL
jgi:hypothetical protein